MTEHVFMEFKESTLECGLLVEVGWAWPEPDHVEARALFVKQAEAVAHMSLENTRGHSRVYQRCMWLHARETCMKLNDELEGRQVSVNTGPNGPDIRWLKHLYEQASMDIGFKIGSSSAGIVLLEAARYGISDVAWAALQKYAPKSTQDAANDAAYFAWFQVAFPKIVSAGFAQTPDHRNSSRIGEIVSGIKIRGIGGRDWATQFLSNSGTFPNGVKLAIEDCD